MFQLYDVNMNKKEFPKGVRPLDISISSIGKEQKLETTENAPGVIRYGVRDTTRSIELKFFLQSNASIDFRHLRNELFGYLDGVMYVVENAFRDRRYLVEISTEFNPSRYDNNQSTGELTLPLTTINLPYAESIDPVAFDDTVVFVDGNKEVEPYRQHLKISITNALNATDYLEIRNLRNNSYLRINDPLESTDEVVIEGVTVMINNGQALRRTDKTFITLEPGTNEISVSGADSADVFIEFRNYYK